MYTDIDRTNKHTKKARLIQKKIILRNGYEITVSFHPGVAGESACINIHNGSANAAEESNQKEYCIPLMEAKELKELAKNINAILREREKTLIKKKKKRTSK